MSKAINLQDVLLNQLRKEKILVTVFLTNGFQIKGTIKGFDNFVVILESEGKQQMIYKHAISTLVPSKAVNLRAAAEQQVDIQELSMLQKMRGLCQIRKKDSNK